MPQNLKLSLISAVDQAGQTQVTPILAKDTPPSLQGSISAEAGGGPGKSQWKETMREAVSSGRSSEGPRVLGTGSAWLLVTHKRISVILLTLTLELLLKDGNRSRRFIKNAPDFPRCPWLVTIPKVP